MPTKLVYFNVRGVCEVARYMLHICNADYEDFRYPIDTSTFKKEVVFDLCLAPVLRL